MPVQGRIVEIINLLLLLLLLAKNKHSMPSIIDENRDMAMAMSSSRADPVLELNILCSCPGWGYLNI